MMGVFIQLEQGMIRAGSACCNLAHGGWVEFSMAVEDHRFVSDEARQITIAPIGELRTGCQALREIIAVLCSVTRGQRHLSTDSRLLAGLAAGHL